MKLLASFTAILLFSFYAAAENTACQKISCDCSSLPSESWKNICNLKERQLLKRCQQTGSQNLGYCSIHGPAATRLPLSLNIDSTTVDQSNSIKLLNYKFAAIYWSMYKDLDFIENQVQVSQFTMADQRLTVLQLNTENLFNLQKQLTQLLKDSGNKEEIKKSWRNFADDTFIISKRLYDYGKNQSNHAQEGSLKIAGKILATAGDLLEQVGYAYSQAESFKQSAESWKLAADISSSAMSVNQALGDAENVAYHRYQASTRLHRASYNWSLNTDQENARKALAESQEFMDDQTELTPLLQKLDEN